MKCTFINKSNFEVQGDRHVSIYFDEDGRVHTAIKCRVFGCSTYIRISIANKGLQPEHNLADIAEKIADILEKGE